MREHCRQRGYRLLGEPASAETESIDAESRPAGRGIPPERAPAMCLRYVEKLRRLREG